MPPRGRDGGKDGEAGFVALKSGKTLKGKGFQLIPPGDRLVVMTPGGGGIGKPGERDRVRIANDLADGLISPETADKDGLSATAYPSGVRGTPVEIAETQTPLIFWRKEFRPDSGGAGRTRGGLGQIMEIESGIDEPFDLLAAFDRIDYPARGREGGGDGVAGLLLLKSGKALKGKGFQLIPPGDRLMIMTPGGGGIGQPAERDRAQVANDLADELISPETADKIYAYKPPQAAE